EELAAQEEEMRQNMEEIQATQEEASKREESFLDVLNSLKKATCFAEYNYEAQLVDCNTNYIQLLSLTQNEAIGKYHWIVGSDTQINIDSFKTIWDELRSGKSVNIQREISQINTKITILEKLSPIFDQSGNPIKFLCIATQLNDFVNHQLKNQ
ncbi:MAG: hypothetical protein KAG95_05620, partial [Bacteroidales bacterium]|nr:hypothetical protein [Bacteroidales bacterium]